MTMDLGLGAFIEKFEAHFGSQLTRAILALVGVTITSICLSTVYRLIFRPLWALMSGIFPKALYGSMGAWFNIAGFIVMAWWCLMAGSKTVEAYRVRRAREETEIMLERVDQVKDAYIEMMHDYAVYRDKVAATQLVAAEIISAAAGNGLISQDLADEFRLLLNTEPETQP